MLKLSISFSNRIDIKSNIINRKKRLTNTPATVSRADTADVEAEGGGGCGGGNAVALLPMQQQPVTVEINAPPPIIEHDEVEEEEVCRATDLEKEHLRTLYLLVWYATDADVSHSSGVCNVQTLKPQDNISRC